MLVEGDLALRQRWYETLTQAGYSVQALASRAMAHDALQHDWPDLILVGRTLPDGTSADLAREVRALHDAVPIVVVGEGPAGAGVQAVTSEDLTSEALRSLVARWIAPPHEERKQLPCSVLVVDDEPKLREMLQRFLELHNFKVLTAASGEDALKMLEQTTPMFVLLDVGMEGMDGLLTLKKIKAMHTPTTVIMVTGNAEESTLKEAMALGAQDYINKPFSPAYLESVLLSKLYTG